jgi:hypothetical protein
MSTGGFVWASARAAKTSAASEQTTSRTDARSQQTPRRRDATDALIASAEFFDGDVDRSRVRSSVAREIEESMSLALRVGKEKRGRTDVDNPTREKEIQDRTAKRRASPLESAARLYFSRAADR